MKASISSWGPAGWTFLHTVTFVYPENPTQADKDRLAHFLFAFTDVIPCMRCQTDFRHMVQKNFGLTTDDARHSRYLDSRTALVKIAIDMHNQVNSKLNKRQMSYDEVTALYTQSEKPNAYDATAALVGAAVLAMIILVLLVARKTRCKK
jgi:hypothetical protein